MLLNIDKKVNNLNDNYIGLKNVKDLICEKIENDILILMKVHKTPKTNTFNIKKDAKNIFANLSDTKNENKFNEGNATPKKRLSNSSQNINKINKTNSTNININNSLFKNNNYLKTQQSFNLDNINEEFDEYNDNSPLNKPLIKSVKMSSYRKKENTSENIMHINDKSTEGGLNISFKENPSLNSRSLEDSSCKFDKNENIEKIIEENKSKEEKNYQGRNEIKTNNCLGDKFELYIQNNTINNNFNNQENKFKNSKKKEKK